MQTAQQLVEQMKEPEKSKEQVEQALSKEHLELRILNEIINQYKKITEEVGALAIKQDKYKEVVKIEMASKFKSLEKNIKDAKDVNFYIAIFSMGALMVFVILLLIKFF